MQWRNFNTNRHKKDGSSKFARVWRILYENIVIFIQSKTTEAKYTAFIVIDSKFIDLGILPSSKKKKVGKVIQHLFACVVFTTLRNCNKPIST